MSERKCLRKVGDPNPASASSVNVVIPTDSS